MQHDPRITISVRLIPACYSNVLVRITQGEASASITVNRADIQHPNPFEQHGLTADCRSHIVHAVRSAIARDGHDRRINWPIQPS